MKPRSSLTLTLTLAFLFFHVASSLPPSASPSSSRLPPEQTVSDLTGIHLRPPPPPPMAAASCPSDRIECAKHRRRRPPPHSEAASAASAERTREFGRRMGLVFVGVALLLQAVFGGFLAYKRIQLRERFSVLPSSSAAAS